MHVARTKTRNINTHQINQALADPLRVSIIEALGRAELSLPELAALLGIDTRLALYHVRILMHAEAVEEQHHGHRRTYMVTHPALIQICHVLYELWAEEATHAREKAHVAL